jgi:glycosyltransferase involved in cell wall biosynthesis
MAAFVMLSKRFPSQQSTRLPILADAVDTWYGYHYRTLCDLFELLLLRTYPSWARWLANRSSFVRGCVFFLSARKYPFVLTTTVSRAAKTYLFLESVFGASQRRLIFIEFIQQGKPNSRSIVKRLAYDVWINWILKPALKKSLLVAHVLTESERSRYGDLFEVPKERFVFIPWPKRRRQDRWPEAKSEASEPSVVSSGREACDWETIFKAAEGQDWHLKVICSRRDLPKVQRLNANGLAQVLCEIPREDHEREVNSAAIYVLSLLEHERSSGHVRISDVTRAGTPIVATAVKGIEGYIDHGETGLLVPPADAFLLRAAVNRLLGDAQYRRRLARNAFDEADKYTREDYMEKVECLVRRAVETGLRHSMTSNGLFEMR